MFSYLYLAIHRNLNKNTVSLEVEVMLIFLRIVKPPEEVDVNISDIIDGHSLNKHCICLQTV